MSSGIVLAMTIQGLTTDGTYFPQAMLVSSLFFPIGLWLLLAPGEVDPALGRRSRRWEAAVVIAGVTGLSLGLAAWYLLGGLAWAGLSP